MAKETPVRELSAFVALFHKAHAKISALQRLDDQIAALCVQHKRLQDEVRGVQMEIDEEFARALRYNQAPAKLPEAIYDAAPLNGEASGPPTLAFPRSAVDSIPDGENEERRA